MITQDDRNLYANLLRSGGLDEQLVQDVINGVDDDDEPLAEIAKFRIKASEEVNLQLSEKLEQSQKRIEQLEEEIESWKKLHQSNSVIFDKVVRDREILRSRIPVGSVVSNLTSSYDEISDVLYISFGDPRPSVCKEVEAVYNQVREELYKTGSCYIVINGKGRLLTHKDFDKNPQAV